MKIGKKKASIVGAVALAVMISVTIGLSLQYAGYMPKSYLVFASDSSPDSYGNMIYQVFIEQNKTGSYTTQVEINTSNYTNDMTVEIDSNYKTRLQVIVWINKTLCPGGQDQADDYTEVKVNVTDFLTNWNLGFVNAGSTGAFYWVAYLSPSWTPATDTTYDVDIRYAAFY